MFRRRDQNCKNFKNSLTYFCLVSDISSKDLKQQFMSFNSSLKGTVHSAVLISYRKQLLKKANVIV